MEVEWGILVAYVAILVMALVPIWVGAHMSLGQKVVPHLSRFCRDVVRSSLVLVVPLLHGSTVERLVIFALF